MKERFLEHLDYARDWLDEAEQEFSAGNQVQGELNLSLAQAEIKRAWEKSQLQRKVVSMPVKEEVDEAASYADEQALSSRTGKNVERERVSTSPIPGRKARRRIISLAAVFLIFILSAVFYPFNFHDQEVQMTQLLEKPALDINKFSQDQARGRYFKLASSLPFSAVEGEIHNSSVQQVNTENSLSLEISTAFAGPPQ